MKTKFGGAVIHNAIGKLSFPQTPSLNSQALQMKRSTNYYHCKYEPESNTKLNTTFATAGQAVRPLFQIERRARAHGERAARNHRKRYYSYLPAKRLAAGILFGNQHRGIANAPVSRVQSARRKNYFHEADGKH